MNIEIQSNNDPTLIPRPGEFWISKHNPTMLILITGGPVGVSNTAYGIEMRSSAPAAIAGRGAMAIEIDKYKPFHGKIIIEV